MVRGGRMGCSISSLSRELVNVTDCGRLQPDQGRAWPPGATQKRRRVAIQLPKVDPVRVEDGQRSG
jgi:hypothetical protein